MALETVMYPSGTVIKKTVKTNAQTIFSDVNHISKANIKFVKRSKRKSVKSLFRFHFKFRKLVKLKYSKKSIRNNVNKHEHYLTEGKFTLQMEHDPIKYLKKWQI